MLPDVIIHNQISLDGAISGFDVNMEQYYGISFQFDNGFRLFGSETVLKAPMADSPETELDFVKPDYDAKGGAPFWIIADSRGRIENLHFFRRSIYCKDVIVLVASNTPQEHLDYLNKRDYDYIVAGDDRIDFKVALGLLNEKYGCNKILTDTGGVLVSHLLSIGVVSKLSLIISPLLTGIGKENYFSTLNSEGIIKLSLKSSNSLPDGCVHIVYDVLKS
jgi:2,5-diamino-6-(ribosylamino)-4(3H)-pyrimidinone 5'-phosphate reductase